MLGSLHRGTSIIIFSILLYLILILSNSINSVQVKQTTTLLSFQILLWNLFVIVNELLMARNFQISIKKNLARYTKTAEKNQETTFLR